MPNPPDICPACGAIVPSNARACPECGSTEETGWSDAAKADSLGIPREDFDYNQFVEEEFSNEPDKTPGLHWFWWVVAVIVLMSILFMTFLRH